MRQFQVVKVSDAWSTAKLTKKVEQELKKLDSEGFEIITVSFGFNSWWIPTAFITVRKEVNL